MFLYSEQCSAINNLSIASALQLSKSGLCNLKLCYIRKHAKVLLSYLSAFLPFMPFKHAIFRYDCIIANFAKRLLLNWQHR